MQSTVPRLLIHILISLLVLLIFNCACEKGPENPVLAKFSGGEVLQSEYIDHFLLSTKYKPQVMPSIENLEEIVSRIAIEKLAVIEAKARKIDQEPTLKQALRKQANKLLFYQYMRQEIIDSVITDSLIRKFYAEYSPQYNLSYILRPVLKTSPAEFDSSQKDTIDYVYGLLKSGQKFEDLARKYSQDITSKDKGGDLGYLIRESIGDAVLRSVMDTLGSFSYSKPVRGYEGWYIVHKGESRTVPVPPLEKVRDRIWRTLYRTRRHLIKEKAEQHFKILAEKYDYQINGHLLETIKQKVVGTGDYSDHAPMNFNKLSETDLATEIAVYEDAAIKLEELFEEKNRVPTNFHDFDERLMTISQQHLFGKQARKSGYQNRPEMHDKIAAAQNALLRTQLFQMVVKDRARAILDSIKTVQKQPVPAKERFDWENKLKQEFESNLKVKYKFKYVNENFAKALEAARLRKLELNKSGQIAK